MTFSRTKRRNCRRASVDIFMPENISKEDCWRKEFAMLLMNQDTSRFIIYAPAQFHHGSNENGQPSFTATIEEDGSWLERNEFFNREVDMEDLFRPWLLNHQLITDLVFPGSPYDLISFRIYSRKIECLHRGEMRYVEP